jgi:hypothetical protein
VALCSTKLPGPAKAWRLTDSTEASWKVACRSLHEAFRTNRLKHVVVAAYRRPSLVGETAGSHDFVAVAGCRACHSYCFVIRVCVLVPDLLIGSFLRQESVFLDPLTPLSLTPRLGDRMDGVRALLSSLTLASESWHRFWSLLSRVVPLAMISD